MYDKNAYCKGTLCRTSDRKFKSIVSGKMMCGTCCIALGNKKYCSFNEVLFDNHPLILKMYKELIGTKEETTYTTKDVTKA